MKFIVGLGNPGTKYNNTRHNVGFVVLQRLAQEIAQGEPATSKFDAAIVQTQCHGEKVILMQPQKFMNRSGFPVKQAITFYKANPETDLLVIVDDIHLPCGTIRLRNTGSAGGHNGLVDIEAHLGDNWSRLRIGVDEPGIIPQVDYVLGKFTPDQAERVEPAINASVKAAVTWVTQGIDEAMNQFNETGKSEKTR